MINWVRF